MRKANILLAAVAGWTGVSVTGVLAEEPAAPTGDVTLAIIDLRNSDSRIQASLADMSNGAANNMLGILFDQSCALLSAEAISVCSTTHPLTPREEISLLAFSIMLKAEVEGLSNPRALAVDIASLRAIDLAVKDISNLLSKQADAGKRFIISPQ